MLNDLIRHLFFCNLIDNSLLWFVFSSYPQDDITEKMYKAVSKILKSKPKDPAQAVTMENLNRVSKAGAGLLQWVLSMAKYYEVAKEVEPRRKKVKEMEKKMLQSQRDLKQIQSELAELEAQIKELSAKYENKNNELQELKTKAEVRLQSKFRVKFSTHGCFS